MQDNPQQKSTQQDQDRQSDEWALIHKNKLEMRSSLYASLVCILLIAGISLISLYMVFKASASLALSLEEEQASPAILMQKYDDVPHQQMVTVKAKDLPLHVLFSRVETEKSPVHKILVDPILDEVVKPEVKPEPIDKIELVEKLVPQANPEPERQAKPKQIEKTEPKPVSKPKSTEKDKIILDDTKNDLAQKIIPDNATLGDNSSALNVAGSSTSTALNIASSSNSTGKSTNGGAEKFIGDGSSTLAEGVEKAILSELFKLVDSRKRYPKAAKRSGAEGVVTLRVTISGGKIKECTVSSGSGKEVLDRAARELANKIVGESISSAKGYKSCSILVPVQYLLK